MMDVLDAAARSRNMSAIRAKDTQPELAVRRYLHGKGYRFRLHRADLPGKPDLVLPRFKLAILVHGCFWHRHTKCFYATSPATRSDFWRLKLDTNVERDKKQIIDLLDLGWRVLIIWECGLKHSKTSMNEIEVAIESTDTLIEWPAFPPRVRIPVQNEA